MKKVKECEWPTCLNDEQSAKLCKSILRMELGEYGPEPEPDAECSDPCTMHHSN